MTLNGIFFIFLTTKIWVLFRTLWIGTGMSLAPEAHLVHCLCLFICSESFSISILTGPALEVQLMGKKLLREYLNMSGYKDFSCDLKLTFQTDSCSDWYRIIIKPAAKLFKYYRHSKIISNDFLLKHAISSSPIS